MCNKKRKLLSPILVLTAIFLGIIWTVQAIPRERATGVNQEHPAWTENDPAETTVPQQTEPAVWEYPEPSFPAQRNFNETEFLLHHAVLMEQYQQTLGQTDIPLEVDMSGELCGLNVMRYDLLYRDSAAVHLVFSFHVDTAQLQKVYFCVNEEVDSPAAQLPQEQLEEASRLFIEVCHGAMKEEDWQELERSGEAVRFSDNWKHVYVEMEAVSLDGIILYAKGVNKALGLPRSEEVTILPEEEYGNE